MKINGIWQHSIVVNADSTITVLDQRTLPHHLTFHRIARWQDAAMAIKEMVVRGAPLIGAVGAYGLAMALQDGEELEPTLQALLHTRPTAVNLAWALNRVHQAVSRLPAAQQASHAWHTANTIAQEDIAINSMIGDNGLEILKTFHMKQPEKPIQILTHCNAGWLATLDWGTALAPIYKAFDAGIPVHVWVDETRPRLQGANLTCWELAQHGVPHTLVTDNTGGHLMQRGMVDICIVGADRVTCNGDACNKIGTYLKALAAKAHNVPFYIALPTPTIDWQMQSGLDIPIEERDAREITHVGETLICPPNTAVFNPGFDVTPAHLITGYITEQGVWDKIARI